MLNVSWASSFLTGAMIALAACANGGIGFASFSSGCAPGHFLLVQLHVLRVSSEVARGHTGCAFLSLVFLKHRPVGAAAEGAHQEFGGRGVVELECGLGRLGNPTMTLRAPPRG